MNKSSIKNIARVDTWSGSAYIRPEDFFKDKEKLKNVIAIIKRKDSAVVRQINESRRLRNVALKRPNYFQEP